MVKPDQKNIDAIRASVRRHIKAAADKWDRPGMMVLDIAPQVHKGAAEFFKHATIETLDIDPESGATYIEDIGGHTLFRLLGKYDCIICTEVLEHVKNPFRAAKNLPYYLKNTGEIYITTPFNLRIHNPLPDLWRFTEHGLRQLFIKSEIVSLEAEESDRELMPYGYRLIVKA